MQEAFKQFVSSECLFTNKHKLLLAVSGGVDSSAMAHLFHASNFSFAIAHCNFNLRGKESDADELFVKSLAKKYNAPFYSVKFDTLHYATNKKISIQMAARELRYKWLEKIRKQHDFHKIALAHNADDVIETLLLNLCRGTGITGLTGIPVKRGSIVRPLLFASRKQIEHYIKSNKLTYREDSSNADDKYTRNKLRHHVVPLLKELNPSLTETITQTVSYLKQADEILRSLIDRERKTLLVKHKNEFIISLKKITKLKHYPFYLHELLKEFGFSSEQTKLIAQCCEHSKPGKHFFSSTHRLLFDREKIIISKQKKTKHPNPVQLTQKDCCRFGNFIFEIKTINRSSTFKIPKQSNIACFDAQKLEFPLQIRKWQAGDKFKPLGMNGFKKVSDFLIDAKTPLTEKETQMVLVSGKDIIWLIGKRIDDRYKISTHTKQIFICGLTEA